MLRVVREYFKCYVNKLNNKYEINNVNKCEIHKLSKVIKDAAENLNIYFRASIRKIIISDSLTRKLYQILRKEIIPILHKVFQEIVE